MIVGYSGGISGEDGKIASWGVDNQGRNAVDVVRHSATVRLAKQGNVMPKWVNEWIVANERAVSA